MLYNGSQRTQSFTFPTHTHRYQYLCLDFSGITRPGLYQVSCGNALSSVFRIAPDVFDRGVWQPVLEYFLPIQMCHMRVSEKYRVWHGKCHMDDARMAPVNWNHFDGYRQGPDTLTRFRPGDCVPGLNCGGWHDAGDFDLRVESQAGEDPMVRSARVHAAAYGFNRADASCIPGGVVSGTALIRPDFPELKEQPFLWQQTEYVLGGGSSRFLFLVLAVRDLLA